MIFEITNRDSQNPNELGKIVYSSSSNVLGSHNSEQFIKDIQSYLKENKIDDQNFSPIIFFWHGYNTNYLESRAAAVSFAEHFDGCSPKPLIILCSWPSAGSKLAYVADLGEVGAASLGFASVLNEAVSLCSNNCYIRLILAGHSMGCAILAETCRNLWKRLEKPLTSPVFSEIILMGADLDNNSLEEGKIGEGMIRLSRRLTYYRNSRDKVLGISAKARLGFTGARLGREGVETFDKIPMSSQVVEVDCTYWTANVKDQHSFYLRKDHDMEIDVFRNDLCGVISGTSKELMEDRIKTDRGYYLPEFIYEIN